VIRYVTRRLSRVPSTKIEGKALAALRHLTFNSALRELLAD
jgi:hypothetical protein